MTPCPVSLHIEAMYYEKNGQDPFQGPGRLDTMRKIILRGTDGGGG